MDDLLNKLVALKAESFVDAQRRRPASTSRRSSSAPASTRASSSACGSARSATTRTAVRDGEAGVAKIDTMSMRAAMQAFDLVGDAAGADARLRRRSEKK